MWKKKPQKQQTEKKLPRMENRTREIEMQELNERADIVWFGVTVIHEIE